MGDYMIGLRIVEVKWIDSAITDGEVYESEIKKDAALMHTIGYVVRDTETNIVLARDKHVTNEPETYRGVITIPKSCILMVNECGSPCSHEESCERTASGE